MPEVASDGPLAGLVVVDLSTTLPGAQATQFLADCGAEVIMVEPPDGSPLRELAGWPALLRGKRSVTLDLHDDADLDRLRALLRRADVMVNTLRPNTAERLGLSPESLSYAVSAVGGRQCHRLGLDRAVPRLQGLGGPGHGEDRRHAREARTRAAAGPGVHHVYLCLVGRRPCRRSGCAGRAARAGEQWARPNRRDQFGDRHGFDGSLQLVLRDGAPTVSGRLRTDGRRLRRSGPAPGLSHLCAAGVCDEGRSMAAVRAGVAEVDRRLAHRTRPAGGARRPEVAGLSDAADPRTSHRVVGHDDRAGRGPHARRMAAGHDGEPRPERRTVPESRGLAGPPADRSRRPRHHRHRPRSRTRTPAVDPHSCRRQTADPASAGPASRRAQRLGHLRPSGRRRTARTARRPRRHRH